VVEKKSRSALVYARLCVLLLIYLFMQKKRSIQFILMICFMVRISFCSLSCPFVRANGLPLLVLHHLVSLPVSTPLRIVNRCWSCSC